MAPEPIDHKETLGQFFSVARGRADLGVINDRIESAARIDGIHMLQLICAMLIASIGLNINSTEAVIGAMLICPLMGSVIDLAYATATMKRGAFAQAFFGLVVQVIVCVATSTLYFALSPLNQTTSYLQAMAEATVWDLIIALVGGFAGGLGISRHETPSTLIAGVAVATALMPPLCTVGYGLADANPAHALYALYLFFVNVVFIGLGAEVVFMGLGIPLQADYNEDGVTDADEIRLARRRQRHLRRAILIFAIATAVPCIIYTQDLISVTISQGNIKVVQDTHRVEITSDQIKALLDDDYVDYFVADESFMNEETESLDSRVVATVLCRSMPSQKMQADIGELIALNNTDVSAVYFLDEERNRWSERDEPKDEPQEPAEETAQTAQDITALLFDPMVQDSAA